MTGSIVIAGRKIGPGSPCYIIAEVSANHNQDLETAKDLIRAAKRAGVDAVKIQTYTPDTLTIDCNAPQFQIGKGTIWEGKNLYQLYKEAFTPWEWHPALFACAADEGIPLFSTPFDSSAVRLLEQLNTPAHKIASFEIVDHQLLEEVAKSGKPVIMSTGMASLAEIDEAVNVLKGAGAKEIVLLKCTSSYPAPPSEMNLRTIPHLSAAFHVPSGLSDHTLGIAVPVAAVALGACVIEKHFTLSRAMPGPDSAFSLEPEEFQSMVTAIRSVEAALGEVSYQVTERESASRIFRRSLFAIADIAPGEPFTLKNIRSIRPGHGLPPKFLPQILKMKARETIRRGTPITWELLS